MNSVVFGTRANKVIPRNFSSIPDPVSTTSTTPTSNSTQSGLPIASWRNVIGRTCNDGIKRSTPEEHTGTDEPAPRWAVMPTVPSGSAIINLRSSRTLIPSGTGLSLLMP